MIDKCHRHLYPPEAIARDLRVTFSRRLQPVPLVPTGSCCVLSSSGVPVGLQHLESSCFLERQYAALRRVAAPSPAKEAQRPGLDTPWSLQSLKWGSTASSSCILAIGEARGRGLRVACTPKLDTPTSQAILDPRDMHLSTEIAATIRVYPEAVIRLHKAGARFCVRVCCL